jgi:hypothetical protein
MSDKEDVQVLCVLPRNKRFGGRQVVLVLSACVEAWDKNPEVRTKNANLVELAKRLAGDVGQLVPASVIEIGRRDGRRRFRIVDGHRRFMILDSAGVEHFLAILYTDIKPGSSQFGELFENLNTATRAIGIRERVWLALNDERMAAGEDACKLADEIKRGLGAEALRAFVEACCPVQAFNSAKRAFNMMKDHLGVDFENDIVTRKAFISKVITWQLEQNEQQQLKLRLTQIGELPASKKKQVIKDLNYIKGLIYGNQGFPKADAAETEAEDEDEDEGFQVRKKVA